MSLKGRSAVVTGSARGIGRGIALKLAEEGASVVINGTTPEAIDQTRSFGSPPAKAPVHPGLV